MPATCVANQTLLLGTVKKGPKLTARNLASDPKGALSVL